MPLMILFLLCLTWHTISCPQTDAFDQAVAKLKQEKPHLFAKRTTKKIFNPEPCKPSKPSQPWFTYKRTCSLIDIATVAVLWHQMRTAYHEIYVLNTIATNANNHTGSPQWFPWISGPAESLNNISNHLNFGKTVITRAVELMLYRIIAKILVDSIRCIGGLIHG